MKNLFKVVAFLVCLFLGFNTYVFAKTKLSVNNNQKDILIIIPNQARPYQEIVNNIKVKFKKTGRAEKFDILHLNASPSRSKQTLKGYKLIISLGAEAAEYCLFADSKSPMLASFITESAFSNISAKPRAQKIITQRFVGGVSLEQPIYRIASLVKLIQANTKSVGVVLGPNTIDKRTIVHMQARRFGWKLNVAEIRQNDNPVKKLRPVYQNSQAVIVMPDRADFNRSIARWIIALSYKYHVPVISYSKKYANAGALISVFSSPQQISQQTAEMAISYLDRPAKRPRKLLSPKYYDLHLNRSVMRALGLKLPRKETLIKQLSAISP